MARQPIYGLLLGNAILIALVSILRLEFAHGTGPATSELAEIDRRLQAAYEHRTYADQLVPLWKRRSELLDALIAARKERLTLTRI